MPGPARSAGMRLSTDSLGPPSFPCAVLGGLAGPPLHSLPEGEIQGLFVKIKGCLKL